MAEQPLDNKITGMTQGFNESSQQRPGIEMALNQQRHCQFEVKGTEKARENEGKLSDFLGSTEEDLELCGCELALFLKERQE